MTKQAAELFNTSFDPAVKLPLRERIAILFDDANFTELLADFKNGINVVVGFGPIDGRKTYLIADNPQEGLPGDISALSAKKCEFLKFVQADLCPLVIFLDSNMIIKNAGAGMHAPPGLSQLMLGKTGVGGYIAEFSKLAGQIPTVAVLAGDLAAGWTFIGAICDVLVMTEGRRMVLARADAVHKVTGKRVDPSTYGGADMHCARSGTGDHKALGDVEAMQWVSRYLSFMPKSYLHANDPVVDSSATFVPLAVDEEGHYPFQTKRPFEMKQIIQSLFDEDSFLEVKELFAAEIIVGFARLRGRVVGVVGSNSNVRYGAIFPESCRKMTKFISICDANSIPLVFLTDTPGLMLDPDIEEAGIIKYMALLLSTLANTQVPKISVMMRRIFGGGFLAMSGPGFADHTIALPSAVAGPWGLSTARVPQSKEEEQGLREVQDMQDPSKLLHNGYIDRVVEWGELRGELARFLDERGTVPRSQPKRIVSI